MAVLPIWSVTVCVGVVGAPVPASFLTALFSSVKYALRPVVVPLAAKMRLSKSVFTFVATGSDDHAPNAPDETDAAYTHQLIPSINIVCFHWNVLFLDKTRTASAAFLKSASPILSLIVLP